MIYIATNIHGRGIRHVTEFDSRHGFMLYAYEVLACSNTNVNASDSIDTLCEKLYDSGVGHGARHHHRISAREANSGLYPSADYNSYGGWG